MAEQTADIARLMTNFAALKQRRAALVAAWRITITEFGARDGQRVDLKSRHAPADGRRWMFELNAVEDEIRHLRKQMLTAGVKAG
jgi:hypothetical protein